MTLHSQSREWEFGCEGMRRLTCGACPTGLQRLVVAFAREGEQRNSQEMKKQARQMATDALAKVGVKV